MYIISIIVLIKGHVLILINKFNKLTSN